MHRMDYSRLFQAIDYSFVPGLIIKIGLILLIAFGLSYFLPRIKRPVLLIAFILLMRIALFQNPLAWYTYARMLQVEDVGFRNRDCLRYELSKYEKHSPLRILAIGSSQMSAVFRFPEGFPDDVQRRGLAGLGPIGLYLMRQDIAEMQPEYLLLYVSDFDIGRKPGLGSARSMPSQGFSFPKFWFDVHAHFESQDIDHFALRELAIGEIFPEYKYNFIFKGYLEMFAKRNAAMRQQVQQANEVVASENPQLKSLHALSEEFMPGNVYFLQELISYLQSKNIGVILVEGQYRPDAYAEHNLVTRDMAANYLQELADKNQNVYFISRDRLRHFEVEDYFDGENHSDYYHVTREPAVEFTMQLMEELPPEARPRNIPLNTGSTDVDDEN